VATPHVEVEYAALNPGAGVHDGVDAAIASIARRDVHNAADREKCGICGSDARACDNT
jgi:hypothetical protein